MGLIVRRDLLKGAAAIAVGGAAAGAGLVRATTGLASAPSAPSAPSVISGSRNAAHASRLLVPVTAGTTYKTILGAEFVPAASSDGWVRGTDYGYRRPGAAVDFFTATVDVPHGAVVTEAQLYLIMNTVGQTATGFLINWQPGADAFSVDHQSTTGTVSANVQTLVIAGITPFSVDRSQDVVQLFYRPSGLAGQEIKGARVGWTSDPAGLVTFPDPRRVFNGAVTPIARNTTTGPIDATLKAAGGASGVPVGAKAAYCAVQANNHTVTGALTLFPDGAADPLIANWSANTAGNLNLFYMMVPLSAAGKFRIHSYINGSVYVDVWGYLI